MIDFLKNESMKTYRNFKVILLLVFLLAGASYSFAQYTTIDEARDYINDRLTHSLIQKIEANGTVTISSPGSKYRFNLRDVSFNYNGGNDDDRVRVFCEECIEKYENKQMKEKLSRQSFLCDTEKEANEVIAAFRFIKKNFQADPQSGVPSDKKLKIQDITLGTRTVGEAIDFINENLSFSMILRISDNGIMTINAPDEIYLVDLSRAEFGYNNSDGDSKVRIYGDFCMEVKKDNGKKEFLSRNSFQSESRVKAYKVITVLYYLKSTYSVLDPSKIADLRNVSGARTDSYKNTAEAIDFINDRLSYSIIMGMDKAGNLTINAPDDIFRFNISGVKFSKTDHSNARSEWFNIPIPGNFAPGVLFECSDCIKKYNGPEDYDTMDEQVFQCSGSTEVKDVLKALSFLKSSIK